MIEDSMDFTICGQVEKIFADKEQKIWVEIKDGIVYQPDEKYLIKTFSTDVLIEEITRRLGVEAIIINQIKQ
jgi:hypothetical protein